MKQPGFIYPINNDDSSLVVEFMHQFLADVVTGYMYTTQDDEECWYGIALGEKEPTIAVVYGKSAAQKLLSLYQETLQEDDDE